ncbi:DUF192 domain-containing protein [Paracoccus onubensis]|uniref:DUF192 domain-containing protein n=1 Tax=Paracoccus onubensis TaxID=1675788 RepID=UPI002731BA7B|nr:DUF192 domain-containing protein [Paracoccus onubensis]MDP0929143.1 DUF192 domain-containing protein [Paracoccus onubensis]
MLPSRLAVLFLCSAATAIPAVTIAAAAESNFECTQDQVAFRTDGETVAFRIEIADTPALREKGLMFREQLPEKNGMLFVYENPRPVSFWMRNTLIPLDMIFMDQSGVIRHIHPDAQPYDETAIPGAAADDSDPNRQFILEIGGGEAARLGLKVGQAMASLAINQAQAAWPCE